MGCQWLEAQTGEPIYKPVAGRLLLTLNVMLNLHLSKQALDTSPNLLEIVEISHVPVTADS
jgi:hypothetical protein